MQDPMTPPPSSRRKASAHRCLSSEAPAAPETRRVLSPFELLERRVLMAATVTPASEMSLVVGATGEFQVLDRGGAAEENVYSNSTDPEEPGLGGVVVRVYDQTRDGAPSPGTTFGLPRAFGANDTAQPLAPVSQTGGGSDTAPVVTTFGGGGLFTVTQTAAKPADPDASFVEVTNVIQNAGDAALTFDFFVAADLSVGGSDEGFNFASRNGATGLTTVGGVSPSQADRLFFQSGATEPALPAPLFKANSYSRIWNGIDIDGTEFVGENDGEPTDARHFDDDAGAGLTDNGIGLEWKGITLAPGASQTITYVVSTGAVTEVPAGDAAPLPAVLSSAPDERGTGVTSYRFTVDYLDDVGIDAESVGDRDVQVVSPEYNSEEQRRDRPREEDPPNEFPMSARLITEEPITGPDGQTGLRATYEVLGFFQRRAAAPDVLKPGTYTVSLKAGEVTDTAGQAVPGGELGTFEVGPVTLSVAPTGDAATLQTALFGGTGVNVTGATLSRPPGATSAGTFASTGNVYNLSPGTTGVILSTGDVRAYESGGNAGAAASTAFESPPTDTQQDLLAPLAPGDDVFHDVTQLDLTFDAPAGVNELFFNFVFGTEEGESDIPDVFGLYVNGVNVATSTADGTDPVNSLSEGLADRSGTELQRVLTENGLALLARAADLQATGNTLTLIIADGGDPANDSTVYVTATAAAPQSPEGNTAPGFDPNRTLQCIAEGVVADGDKKLLACYVLPAGSVTPTWLVLRLNENGANDPTFGAGNGRVDIGLDKLGATGGRLYDIAVDANHNVYVTGEADGMLAVAKITAAGQLDESFGDGGIKKVSFFGAGGDVGYSIALDGDKVLVAGSASKIVGGKFTRDWGLARFGPDGQLDPTFVGTDTGTSVPAGMVVTDVGRDQDEAGEVLVHGDRIYAAGRADRRVAVAAYDRATGALVNTESGPFEDGRRFLGGGETDILYTADRTVGLAVEPDGQLIVVASTGGAAGGEGSNFGLVRLKPDGSINGESILGPGDPIYVSTDFGGTDDPDEVEVLPDGNLLVSGTYRTSNTLYTATALYRPDGTLVREFGAGGLSFFNPVAVGTAGSVDTGGGSQGSGLAAGTRKAAVAFSNGQGTVVGARGDNTTGARGLEVDFAAPTAAVATPAPITDPSNAPQAVQVTFTDVTGVDASDITPQTLTFTRQGTTTSLPVTVSLDSNDDGTTRVATYSIAPPGGTWDPADNGTYEMRLVGGLVSDTTQRANTMTEQSLGTFTVNLDPATFIPTATLVAIAPPVEGGQSYDLTISYSDNTAIDVSTIGTDDVTVTGPSGALTVQSVSVNSNADGSPRTATYTVAAPGGTWDGADLGTYQVALTAGQVSDVASPANFVAADAALGSFAFEPRVELGPVGTRATYQTGNGTSFTITVKGGTGTAFRVGENAVDLDLTSPASNVVIKTQRGARITLRNVTASGGLRGINAKSADLKGALTSSGGVGKLVLGAIDQAEITVGGITALQAASLSNAEIRSAGSVGKVAVAGNVTASSIFAGVRADLETLPDSADDFVTGAARLTSVSVRGAFNNSRIAAPTVGKVALRSVDTTNGGVAFGLASNGISAVSGPPLPRLRALTRADQSQQRDDYLIRILSPGAQQQDTPAPSPRPTLPGGPQTPRA